MKKKNLILFIIGHDRRINSQPVKRLVDFFCSVKHETKPKTKDNSAFIAKVLVISECDVSYFK